MDYWAFILIQLQSIYYFYSIPNLKVITPLVSVAMDYASYYIYVLHILPLGHLPKIVEFILWVVYTIILVLLAHFITKKFSPFSAGSGIPEVKVIMSGNDLPQYLSFRVLAVKVIGLTLVIGAGLFAGKQGPMVHIGAIIAYLLLKLKPFKCKKSLK